MEPNNLAASTNIFSQSGWPVSGHLRSTDKKTEQKPLAWVTITSLNTRAIQTNHNAIRIHPRPGKKPIHGPHSKVASEQAWGSASIR